MHSTPDMPTSRLPGGGGSGTARRLIGGTDNSVAKEATVFSNQAAARNCQGGPSVCAICLAAAATQTDGSAAVAATI